MLPLLPSPALLPSLTMAQSQRWWKAPTILPLTRLHKPTPLLCAMTTLRPCPLTMAQSQKQVKVPKQPTLWEWWKSCLRYNSRQGRSVRRVTLSWHLLLTRASRDIWSARQRGVGGS